MGFIIEGLNKFLYNVTYVICYLIDLIVGVFKKLAGIESIGSETASNNNILEDLFFSSGVKTAFWVVLGLSITILIIITLIGVFKSYTKDNPQAELKEVMTGSLKAIGWFIAVNVIMVAAITVVPILFNAVNSATVGNGSDVSLGGSFIAGEALDSYDLKNYDGDLAKLLKGEYEVTQLGGYGSFVGWDKFNNFLVIFISLPTLVSFFYCMTLFVKRIFGIISLYISAPVVFAMQPNDGGFATKKWTESLFSQLFSVLGVIVLLNIFLMICPQIDKWSLSSNAKSNAILIGLIKSAGAIGVCAGADFVNKLLCKDNGKMRTEGKERKSVLSGILGGRGKAGKDCKDAGKGASGRGVVLAGGRKPMINKNLVERVQNSGRRASSNGSRLNPSLGSINRGTNGKYLSSRAAKTGSSSDYKRAKNIKQIMQNGNKARPVVREKPKINLIKKE